MLTEKIEMFLEVAESLNFSEVAKKRYTTQPTISRQITALEEEWGIPLFVRSNKGLRLTPEGSVMFQCCQSMYHQCEAALETARDLKFGNDKKLRLGFLEILDVERIFLPCLQAFTARYPELDISVSCDSFGGLREGLESGRLDIIHTFDFDIRNLTEEVLADEMGVLNPLFVISHYHPLFGRKQLKIEDLKDECFYIPAESDSPGRTADLQRILRTNGIPNSRIYKMPNLDSVLMQMRLGKGVALVDTGTKGIWNDQYRIIAPSRTKDSFHLVAVWKKDNLNSSVALYTQSMAADISPVLPQLQISVL